MNISLHPTTRGQYKHKPTSFARGFGIVELMVAVAIGMVVILVMMQVFAHTEQWNRNTSQGSDTQTNVQLAAYIISQNLANAGGSLSSSRCSNAAVEPGTAATTTTAGTLGAYRTQYDRVWMSGNSNFFLPTLPVRITHIDDNRGDRLEFLSQHGIGGIGGQRLWDRVDNPGDPLVVRSFQGLENGGWMLVSTADPAAEATEDTFFRVGGVPYNCAMVQLTDIALNADGLYNLSHTTGFPGELVNKTTGKLGGDSHIASGTPSTHWVQGLGRLETSVLEVKNPSEGGPLALIRTTTGIDDSGGISPQVLVEAPDVVHLRAFYGFDNQENPDGTVTNWLEPGSCQTNNGNTIDTMGWQCENILNNNRARTSERLVAIRFGIVMRVAQHDKDYAAADATVPPPDQLTLWKWQSVAGDASYPSGDPVYKVPDTDKNAVTGRVEYRYRILQAVVPLRSAIWNVSKP